MLKTRFFVKFCITCDMILLFLAFVWAQYTFEGFLATHDSMLKSCSSLSKVQLDVIFLKRNYYELLQDKKKTTQV